MKINWQERKDIIQFILDSRYTGDTLKEISKKVGKDFGLKCSTNQIHHVLVTYGPDSELEDVDSGKALVSIRRSQNNARSANAKVRKIADLVMTQEDMLNSFKEVVKKLNISKITPTKLRKYSDPKDTKMTVELLFSDWQIGKKMSNYDSKVAIRRVKEYTSCAINEIGRRLDSGFAVEKICLIFLGDIVESAEKAAQKNSPNSVDCGTPEQMQLSIKHLFVDLIAPLESLGIPLDITCVTGNHDSVKPGMIYYNPGKEQLTWTIYKSLELLSEQSGFKGVSFNIPEGYFSTVDYYGQTALYEHGYGLAATETALNNRRNERMRQLKSYIHYFRMGDKHNICRFNDDSLVVNGAFFGDDEKGTEYSSISGYASIASQLMFFHVKRKDSRKTIYDSFSIQLHHVQ